MYASPVHIRLPSKPTCTPCDDGGAVGAGDDVRAPFESAGALIRTPFRPSHQLDGADQGRHGYERESDFSHCGSYISIDHFSPHNRSDNQGKNSP